LIREATRKAAVERICDAIDEASLVIPELDQLLARLAGKVEAIKSRVHGRAAADPDILVRMQSLAWDLQHLGGSLRTRVWRFEKGLAAVTSRLAEQEPHVAIEET
jgi:hypothetical protein